MIVPIHAYPKMNIHMKGSYIPKYIDLGTIALNSSTSKEIILKNIITVPFEYEFVPVKDCKEITIIPALGDIDAFSNKAVKIIFHPESYGSFSAEYEFRLSEFDFKAVLVTIFGACNVFDKVINENIIKRMKKLKDIPELDLGKFTRANDLIVSDPGGEEDVSILCV